MVVIEIRFDGNKKIYQYLLINPNKYKIDKKKKLIFSYGATGTKTIQQELTAVKAYKVDQLPPIITSQIVLLDGNNNIDIQKIGTVNLLPKQQENRNPTKPHTADQKLAGVIGLSVSRCLGKIFNSK